MFSFLTSFSGYIGKIFAKPAVPHYTIILDDQLSKAISLKAFIFTQERSSEVEKVWKHFLFCRLIISEYLEKSST